MVLGETSVDDPSMQHFQFSGKPFSCPGRVNFYNIALQWHFTYSNTDVFRLQSISMLDEASPDDHWIQYFQLIVISCPVLFSRRGVASADLIHLVIPGPCRNPDDECSGILHLLTTLNLTCLSLPRPCQSISVLPWSHQGLGVMCA